MASLSLSGNSPQALKIDPLDSARGTPQCPGRAAPSHSKMHVFRVQRPCAKPKASARERAPQATREPGGAQRRQATASQSPPFPCVPSLPRLAGSPPPPAPATSMFSHMQDMLDINQGKGGLPLIYGVGEMCGRVPEKNRIRKPHLLNSCIDARGAVEGSRADGGGFFLYPRTKKNSVHPP